MIIGLVVAGIAAVVAIMFIVRKKPVPVAPSAGPVTTVRKGRGSF
jgi:hypothetical protein